MNCHPKALLVLEDFREILISKTEMGLKFTSVFLTAFLTQECGTATCYVWSIVNGVFLPKPQEIEDHSRKTCFDPWPRTLSFCAFVCFVIIKSKIDPRTPALPCDKFRELSVIHVLRERGRWGEGGGVEGIKQEFWTILTFEGNSVTFQANLIWNPSKNLTSKSTKARTMTKWRGRGC
jgi:hypothetical protein